MKPLGKQGEHPFGDAGQLILLGLFLVVWVGDSFFLRKSTFLSDSIPSYIRQIIFGLFLVTAFFLVKSGHVVISHKQRSAGLLSKEPFDMLDIPCI